jgi:hypothetical protein
LTSSAAWAAHRREDVEEAGEHGGDHADAGDADAGRRRHRRGHALQAEQEQEGGARSAPPMIEFEKPG